VRTDPSNGRHLVQIHMEPISNNIIMQATNKTG
jgi:hypothetical protein